MITGTLGISLTGAGFSITGSLVSEGGKSDIINEPVASEATITLAQTIDVSQLKAFAFSCDRACEIVFLAADDQAAILTRALLPGQVLFWSNAIGLTNPLTEDIGSITVENTDPDNEGTISGVIIVDPTV